MYHFTVKSLMCVCERVRACVRACVHGCVRACVAAEENPSEVSGHNCCKHPRIDIGSKMTVSFHLSLGLPQGCFPSIHHHFGNWSGVFSFISSFHLPEPFQLFLLMTIPIGSTFASSNISCCFTFNLCLTSTIFRNNQLCS